MLLLESVTGLWLVPHPPAHGSFHAMSLTYIKRRLGDKFLAPHKTGLLIPKGACGWMGMLKGISAMYECSIFKGSGANSSFGTDFIASVGHFIEYSKLLCIPPHTPTIAICLESWVHGNRCEPKCIPFTLAPKEELAPFASHHLLIAVHCKVISFDCTHSTPDSHLTSRRTALLRRYTHISHKKKKI